MSDSPLSMGKNAEEIKAINETAVRSAMAALYDTHIEDSAAASLRGAAIRAVAALADNLGFTGLIHEMESVPATQRRRESWLWKEKP